MNLSLWSDQKARGVSKQILTKMKSKEEHLISGTYRPDRHDKTAGTRMDELPEAPAHLSEAEQQTFTEVCQRLYDNDCLSESDLYVIEAFAIQMNILRQAKAQLETAGKLVEVYVNKGGNANNSPSAWVNIIQKSSDQLLKLSAKLGLNPIDRAKQTRTQKKETDHESLLK